MCVLLEWQFLALVLVILMFYLYCYSSCQGGNNISMFLFKRERIYFKMMKRNHSTGLELKKKKKEVLGEQPVRNTILSQQNWRKNPHLTKEAQIICQNITANQPSKQLSQQLSREGWPWYAPETFMIYLTVIQLNTDK